MANKFEIIIHEEQDAYSPGQLIRGVVVIETQENIKAKSLKLVIEGAARTSWTRNLKRTSPRQSCNISNAIHSKVRYIDLAGVLWTEDHGSKIFPAGVHHYKFEFYFPKYIPPTFNGSHGSISYSMSIVLEQTRVTTKQAEKFFEIDAGFDFDLLPKLIPAVIDNVTRNTGLIFKNGIVDLKVELPKQGFVPGETIPIEYIVENQSCKPVIAIRAKLIQVVKYLGRESIFHGGFIGERQGKYLSRTSENTIAKVEKEVNILQNQNLSGLINLAIPMVVPSFNSKIIKLEYKLIVTAKTTSFFYSTAESKIDVAIVTFKIRNPPTYLSSIDVESPPPEYEVCVKAFQKLGLCQTNNPEKVAAKCKV